MRRPDMPVELEQVILRAMALEAHVRPSAPELEHALLAFCRPTYREHMIERMSNAGIPWGTPPPGTAPPHRGSHAPVPLQGTDPTLLAPTGMTAPRRSKLPWIFLAAVLIGGGVAAAVVLSNKEDPAPQASIETTPAPTPTPTPTVPPTPAATPPAGAPPVAPAAPTKVTIKLAVDPATATITIDGKPVTGGELVVDRDGAEHELSITADGFKPHTEKLTFDENQRLVINLDKKRKTTTRPPRPRPPGGRQRPDRIEDESPY
jgi:hypothetical protein